MPRRMSNRHSRLPVMFAIAVMFLGILSGISPAHNGPPPRTPFALFPIGPDGELVRVPVVMGMNGTTPIWMDQSGEDALDGGSEYTTALKEKLNTILERKLPIIWTPQTSGEIHSDEIEDNFTQVATGTPANARNTKSGEAAPATGGKRWQTQTTATGGNRWQTETNVEDKTEETKTSPSQPKPKVSSTITRKSPTLRPITDTSHSRLTIGAKSAESDRPTVDLETTKSNSDLLQSELSTSQSFNEESAPLSIVVRQSATSFNALGWEEAEQRRQEKARQLQRDFDAFKSQLKTGSTKPATNRPNSLSMRNSPIDIPLDDPLQKSELKKSLLMHPTQSPKQERSFNLFLDKTIQNRQMPLTLMQGAPTDQSPHFHSNNFPAGTGGSKSERKAAEEPSEVESGQLRSEAFPLLLTVGATPGPNVPINTGDHIIASRGPLTNPRAAPGAVGPRRELPIHLHQLHNGMNVQTLHQYDPSIVIDYMALLDLSNRQRSPRRGSLPDSPSINSMKEKRIDQRQVPLPTTSSSDDSINAFLDAAHFPSALSQGGEFGPFSDGADPSAGIDASTASLPPFIRNTLASYLLPRLLSLEALTESLPGVPGIDYPILSVVPYTNFYCSDMPWPGFYADTEARCQAWHYCDLDGRQATFLCPNGTVFHQAFFVCDWWYNFECPTAPGLYALNQRIFDVMPEVDPTAPHRTLTADILEAIFL